MRLFLAILLLFSFATVHAAPVLPKTNICADLLAGGRLIEPAEFASTIQKFFGFQALEYPKNTASMTLIGSLKVTTVISEVQADGSIQELNQWSRETSDGQISLLYFLQFEINRDIHGIDISTARSFGRNSLEIEEPELSDFSIVQSDSDELLFARHPVNGYQPAQIAFKKDKNGKIVNAYMRFETHTDSPKGQRIEVRELEYNFVTLGLSESNLKLLEQVHGEIVLAVDWARAMFNGTDAMDLEEQVRRSSERLIPYGRTYVSPISNTRERKVSQVFRISQNSNHMIFLQAKKGSIQLLMGAPISKETMDRAVVNSAYLFLQPETAEPRFFQLFKFVTEASDRLKEAHGVNAYAGDQDPFNQEVAAIGNVALISLDLNKALTNDQLVDFLLLLWMGTEGQSDGIE